MAALKGDFAKYSEEPRRHIETVRMVRAGLGMTPAPSSQQPTARPIIAAKRVHAGDE
jgi:hypothetical protein